MTKKTTIIAISILAVVILIGSGVLVWQNKQKMAQEKQKKAQYAENLKKGEEEKKQQSAKAKNSDWKKVDTSNWKTYRDEKYKFEIKYNPNWEVKQDPGVWNLGEESMYFIIDKSRNDIGINIGRIKSNKNPKEWFVEKQIGSNSVVFDNEYLINSYNAYYAKVDIPNTYIMHDYVISNKKNLILFSFEEKYSQKNLNTGEIKETSFSQYLPEFEAMINSIRFLD